MVAGWMSWVGKMILREIQVRVEGKRLKMTDNICR